MLRLIFGLLFFALSIISDIPVRMEGGEVTLTPVILTISVFLIAHGIQAMFRDVCEESLRKYGLVEVPKPDKEKQTG